MVFWPDEGLEEGPGLAGELPEKDSLVGGQPRGAARQRPAEPPDESREAIQRARMGLATASAAGRKSAR